MLKRRGLTSPSAVDDKPDGPPRGGWVYGSFNGNSDENMRTLQRKHIARTSSFGTMNSTLRRNSSSCKDMSPSPTQSSNGKFSMLEFSMMYYRQNIDRYEALKANSRGLQDSIKMIENLKLNTIKKKLLRKNSEERLKCGGESWSWKEQAEAIKWTNVPIENSLLKLPTEDMSREAVGCFKCTLMFMGDMELPESYSEIDCVFRIMKACHQRPELRDEIYCQLTKQTTTNKSSNQSSCTRGWRLLVLLCCWFSCSDILKPFLLNYLQQNASDPCRPHHTVASTCLAALRKTLKYGGRRNIPTTEEIAAFTGGKFSKRQNIQLPGQDCLVINVTPFTLVKEVIEDVCTKLGIIGQSEMDEYALFTITDSDHTTRLKREEYLLDIISQMRLHHLTGTLYFERICWYHFVHYDLISDQCTEMMYNQVAQTHLDGWLICIPDNVKKVPNRLLDDIIKVASLMWRIGANHDEDLNLETCRHFVPDIVIANGLLDVDQVVTGMSHCLTNLVSNNTSQIDFKIDVIEMLRRMPMFGASFYIVKCDTEPRLAGDIVMAINRAGIHFLDHKTRRVVLSYPFTEVISTRKSVTDFSEHLDIKVGNNSIQKVIRLETIQSCDIIYLIGQYVKILNNSAKHSV